MIELLERGRQEIPRTPEQFGPLAPSEPLDMLAMHAPLVPNFETINHRRFPTISNDDSALYWEQVKPRVLTEEYRDATNRTAVLIGESSLLAALPDISEDTIVLLDKSPEMVSYMRRYVEAIRSAKDMAEWGNIMLGPLDDPTGAKDQSIDAFAEGCIDQAQEWKLEGRAHPFIDEGIFEESKKILEEKAVIHWLGDITDPSDMAKLGQALNKYDANVTLLNITNVPGCDIRFINAEQFADTLGLLPVVANAPILATSRKPKFDHKNERIAPVVESSGPFFGLENLRKIGGNTGDGLRGGPIVEREFIDPDSAYAVESALYTREVKKKRDEAAELLTSILRDFGHDEIFSVPGTSGIAFGGIVEMTPDGAVPIDFGSAPPEVQEAIRSLLKDQDIM